MSVKYKVMATDSAFVDTGSKHFIFTRNLAGGRRAYLTWSPASRKALAVPPDATKARPTETRRLAKSNKPFLSDTLSNALRTNEVGEAWS